MKIIRPLLQEIYQNDPWKMLMLLYNVKSL